MEDTKMKVQSLINEVVAKNGDNKKIKKTRNTDLYLKTIVALAEDDDYVATYIDSVDTTGEIITKKDKLAPKFRKIIAKAIKKCTSLSMEEAEEAAKAFRLSQDDALTLHDIVTESIYINIENLNKKVQLIHKPDMDVMVSSTNVKETVRNNPKDDTKQTVIAARKKMKADTKIHAFQKTTRIRKG